MDVKKLIDGAWPEGERGRKSVKNNIEIIEKHNMVFTQGECSFMSIDEAEDDGWVCDEYTRDWYYEDPKTKTYVLRIELVVSNVTNDDEDE